MEIDFGQKFVSKSLDDLISANWEKSFRAKTVLFDCSKLEWISNPEIAFFFSWIHALEEKKTPVTIQLQSSYRIPLNGDIYTKRKYCLERILIQWKLRTHISNKTTILDGGIQADTREVRGFSNYSHIPIQSFHASSFDQDFDNVFTHYLSRFAESLRSAVQKTDIKYYDSQFLDYSVFKELYSNACLHAEKNIINECFFSIGLNRKFAGDSAYLSASRLSELSDAERDFFSENNLYRNIDFIELTFHDFGVGIAKSLQRNYLNESHEVLHSFFGANYDKHIANNLDTRVIEYALLLFTSRFEIERKLDIHGYIPRGLYIIKELVKQYHGYFEVSSLQGSVGLSFKDGKITSGYRKNKEEQLLFPGTKIKIVFPALHADYNVKQQTISSTATPLEGKDRIVKNIHFLKEFCAVESEHKLGEISDSQVIHQKIIGHFFSRMLDHFRNSPSDALLMIDFAGTEPSTIDFYNKFIYFVTHFPLYGQRQLIFYNVFVKGLNRTVIVENRETLKAKGIIASTIPCIHLDHCVEWLGVDTQNDAEHFTGLWKGDETDAYSFANLTRYNSSLIKVTKERGQYKVELLLMPFNKILQLINRSIIETIDHEIANEGIQYDSLHAPFKTNYNNITVSKDRTCYLNARGKLVLKYISFTEKLYIVSYRRMIAAYFIFKLYHTTADGQHPKKPNKILSVTLSSQMIGHEVVAMLEALQQKEIKLIALSNYYNFQNEEKFSDIKPKNKVLIVNDVISTGNLTRNIIKSIELADAIPVCCLSIVDLSIAPITESDTPIISLTRASVDYLECPPAGYEIEVINPVMNVPTSMQKTKSKENVLMSKEDFFARIDEKYLVLGNMRNNSVYFNYFLNTKEMLADDQAKGYPLLNQLLLLLRGRKQAVANAEVVNLVRGVDIVARNISDTRVSKNFERIKKDLHSILQNSSPTLFDEYKVDVVFYPFLSNVSLIEQDKTPFVEAKLNNTGPKIYPIPRIMTTKGWRFSFPPKFLNHFFNSNNLSVLILDDGSLSGDTIMQMIDSVSFLSVKSIDVLSIFGRVEDFQKELLSRIKSVQVKNAVVPITVFFGSHVNIPVHNQFESAFQTEYREILTLEDRLINHYKIELSPLFETYLQKRKVILLEAQHPSIPDKHFHLFDCISPTKVFHLRDFIGRFGSYRLYLDDLSIKDVDLLVKSKEDLLIMLTVLNLEPQLYQTFKRMFGEDKIKEKIQIIVDEFLTSDELMRDEWMKEFFIKSLFYLSSKWFFNSDNLLNLVKQIYKFSNTGARESFRYLEYLIILVKASVKNTDNIFKSDSFDLNVEEFISNLKLDSDDIFKELRFAFSVYEQIQSRSKLDYQFYINKYHHLRNYFVQTKVYETKHDEKLLPNYFAPFLKAVSELKYSMEYNIQADIEDNTDRLYTELTKLSKNYSQDLNFKFIDEIVNNLRHFSPSALPFNVDLSIQVISDLKVILNGRPVISQQFLQETLNTISLYMELLLKSNSLFAAYVLRATSHILDEWKKAEKAFMGLPELTDILPIDLGESENISVNVHPYALNLAFENILKNKCTYAKSVPWRMKTDVMADFTDLIIEQDSEFDKNTGDGTGQSAIRSILRNYGVQYRRIKDNPYTLKITFSNKTTEDENT